MLISIIGRGREKQVAVKKLSIIMTGCLFRPDPVAARFAGFPGAAFDTLI